MKNLKVKNTCVFVFRLSILLIIVGCFSLSSCKQNIFKDKDQLITYLQNNENTYIQHKTINGVDFSLMYKPTDLMVSQELGDSASAKEILELRDKYSKYMYFNLSMSKNHQELLSTIPNNRSEFGAMVNQLAFGMNGKVHVFTQHNDTIEMIDFIYPRMYGMSRSTSMMFVYPRDEKTLDDKYLNFSIEDLGLGTGEVKFKIESKKIKDEPQLKFEI
ncbi:MAG: hypothetical protein HRU49_13385 [Winogradskyella sp.]|uniref:hypothetical protein n=1 Tax=Winogradskyella sp. TaxID=1883156 RepID=UPI0025CF9B5C|nr:hypothetical protein [Winogradskyella sp.]NRB84741.1 hypothetical protein [Winogradskyella sp.]